MNTLSDTEWCAFTDGEPYTCWFGAWPYVGWAWNTDGKVIQGHEYGDNKCFDYEVIKEYPNYDHELYVGKDRSAEIEPGMYEYWVILYHDNGQLETLFAVNYEDKHKLHTICAAWVVDGMIQP